MIVPELLKSIIFYWQKQKSGFFIGLLILFGLTLVSPLSGKNSTRFFKQDSFVEALKIVQEQSVFIEQPININKIKSIGLQAYLSQYDPYAQFFNPADYQQFKEYQKESYVGLGMELKKDAAGNVFCFPYPDSPAQKAGIQNGDQLLAINGQDVAKKSLFSLTKLATGKIGTQVELLVATATTQPRKVYALLAHTQVKSISSQTLSEAVVAIKIAFFSERTKFDLVNAIEQLSPEQIVIFDLRGNPGGNFYAALECADLFIPEGKILISAMGKGTQINYRSSAVKKYLHSKFFIWQDSGTASAAEVFAAAMVDNEMAISIGETSYGKGTKQNIFELHDNSALLLTTEFLTTPAGLKYNAKGLPPVHQLNKTSPQLLDYTTKTIELVYKK